MSKASVFRFQYLFKKYLDNTCNLSELEELFELVGKEGSDEQLENLVKRFWLEMADPSPQEINHKLQETRYNKLLETIQLEKKIYSFERSTPKWVWWSAAASVLIVLFSVSYLFLGNNVSPKLKSKTLAHTKLPDYVHVIKLSDGSVVYLNKGSHLDYPARFSGTKREVYLIGEGYFDIKHDNAHPFLVYAGGTVTQVLGTAFNIKMEGNKVKVTVTRGKVSVTDRKKVLGVITPDQQISYNTSTHQIVQDNINSKATILWKAPDLVMDNMTLKEAAIILTERYGESVKLGSHELDNCRFSATFLNTTQLDQAIEVLSRLNNLKINHDSDSGYTLSGPGCN